MEDVNIKNHYVLFKEGDEANYVYFIKSGQIEVKF
jgi:CRP-like cAMP-binding protein